MRDSNHGMLSGHEKGKLTLVVIAIIAYVISLYPFLINLKGSFQSKML